MHGSAGPPPNGMPTWTGLTGRPAVHFAKQQVKVRVRRQRPCPATGEGSGSAGPAPPPARVRATLPLTVVTLITMVTAVVMRAGVAELPATPILAFTLAAWLPLTVHTRWPLSVLATTVAVAVAASQLVLLPIVVPARRRGQIPQRRGADEPGRGPCTTPASSLSCSPGQMTGDLPVHGPADHVGQAGGEQGAARADGPGRETRA